MEEVKVEEAAGEAKEEAGEAEEVGKAKEAGEAY